MLNNNSSLVKKQACNKISSIQPLIDIISEMPSSYKSVLDYIVGFDLRGKNASQRNTWASQTTISGVINRSRMTVNKIIKFMCEYGIISKTYRHRHTCVYGVSPLLRSPFVQAALRDVLPAIKKYGLMVLLVSGNASFTPSKNKNYKEYMSSVDDINIAIRSRTRGTSPRLIGLGLSMEEKIRLSAFSDADIHYAVVQSARFKGSWSHGLLCGYLFGLCWKRCVEQGHKPNWGFVHQLQNVHEVLQQEHDVLEYRTKKERIEIERGPCMDDFQYKDYEDVDCLEQHHTIQDFKKEPQQVRNSKRILNLTPTPTRKPIEEIKSRPERLMSRSEYNMAVKNLMDKPDFFTNISREVLKNKQRALYDQLSPEQQEAWRKGL